MKVKSGTMPSPYDVSISDGNAIIRFAENVIEKQNTPQPRKRQNQADAPDEEITTYYEYDCYTLVVPNRVGLIDDLNSNLAEWIAKAKQNTAVALANEIRAKRDELLAETDKEMAFDRLDIHIPDKITATTLLSVVKAFIGSIGGILNGDMARYRQALRDIPQQEGFPYNVKFPIKPNI